MRKSFLKLILLGVLFTLIALLRLNAGNSTAGNANVQSENSGSASGPETLVNPPEIKSSNGVLETTLTTGNAKVKIGDREVMSTVYNGIYVPPTLRVRPGDKLRLKLRNELNQETNLHYHGLQVSPSGRADNIFLNVGAGDSFDYEVDIQRSRSAG